MNKHTNLWISPSGIYSVRIVLRGTAVAFVNPAVKNRCRNDSRLGNASAPGSSTLRACQRLWDDQVIRPSIESSAINHSKSTRHEAQTHPQVVPHHTSKRIIQREHFVDDPANALESLRKPIHYGGWFLWNHIHQHALCEEKSWDVSG